MTELSTLPIKRVLAILLTCCNASAIFGDQPKLFDELGTPLKRSALFSRLSDGQELFSEGPDELLVPASTSKLVISAAALERYGPDFQFVTLIYYSGSRIGGTISGDLIVVGGGDPMLTNEKLWQLAADLKHLGIKKIKGNLLVDNRRFQDGTRDESRQDKRNESKNAYDAPVSALGVNFNTYAIALSAGPQNGAKANVSIDPYPLTSVAIENNLKTIRASGKPEIIRTATDGGASKLTVGGSIGPAQGLKKVYRSVTNASLSAGDHIRAFLEHEGILIEGKVVEGAVKPGKDRLLLKVNGYELRRIVQGLNFYSNNYIADVLTKNLSVKNGVSGTLEAGTKALKDFMAYKVKASGKYNLANGSGLSVKNRLSARQLVQVLRYMYNRVELFPDYLASLPAAGLDGTLKTRFNDSEVRKGWVRAKSGTLQSPISVAALAGYTRHPTHGWVAFAIIDNGVYKSNQPSIWDLRKHQDSALMRFLRN